MKKTIAIALSLIMLLAMLAACGGGDTAPSSSAPAADAPAAEAPAADAPPPADAPPAAEGGSDNTVTVWCWDPAFNLYAMDEAAKIYKTINPDFEINIVEVPWDDIQITLTTAATSGDLSQLPDIFLMQDNAFTKNVMISPELFTDLTGSGIDFGQFGPGKLGYTVVDGRNYGVPFDAGTTVFAIRTDIIEAAGLTVADFTDITWSQFIELGSQLSMPVVSTTAGGGDFIAFMLQSAGSSLFNSDGSPNIVGNTALIESIRVYQELVASGVLLEVNNWDEYIGSFTSGAVAGTISGCWILGSVQLDEANAGNWAVTSIPRLELPGAANASSWGGSSWAVTSSAKNPELAIDFLANTFAGSVAFYENILEQAGALSTWIPAGASSVYGNPQEFFGGQPVYADIVRWTGNVPAVYTGVFFYEGVNAVTDAIVKILGGADMDTELQAAQDLVIFQMGG